jgi:hypothetical protein
VVVGGGAVGVEMAPFLAEKGTMSTKAVKFLPVNGPEDPKDLLRIRHSRNENRHPRRNARQDQNGYRTDDPMGDAPEAREDGNRNHNRNQGTGHHLRRRFGQKGKRRRGDPAGYGCARYRFPALQPVGEASETKGYPQPVNRRCSQDQPSLGAIHQGFEAGRPVWVKIREGWDFIPGINIWWGMTR